MTASEIAEITALRRLFEAHRDQILSDYFDYLRFPSISTDSDHIPDVLACAAWVERYLDAAGFHVERWETAGHPTIFASYEVDPQKPTVLIYNHYDVQPVTEEQWQSPPFEPTVRDGEVFARGAQ
ncbi:MAG: M20/M25/M40 family metallo-hydrolase, partial [Bdellovibrionales bacterium]|nr:M20/M25/M40 family metallo-hydrolase [Bdellovibrionales bacterium]